MPTFYSTRFRFFLKTVFFLLELSVKLSVKVVVFNLLIFCAVLKLNQRKCVCNKRRETRHFNLDFLLVFLTFFYVVETLPALWCTYTV